MNLKVSTPSPILGMGRKSKDDHQDISPEQETGNNGKRIPKVSSSSKLKAMVKNGKKALIKVLPKSGTPSNGEKRDYDTDSSSQDHEPLLLDSETSTDEESNNGGDNESFGHYSPMIANSELPVATPIEKSPTPSPEQPNRQVRQVQRQEPSARPVLQQARRQEPATRKGASIKVNINSHRSRAFYEASKNAAEEKETNVEEKPSKFPNLTCHVPEFPSDISGVSDNVALPPKDHMDNVKLVSKVALLKALQVSGAIADKGNTLCVTTCTGITKAPASIEGAMLEIISTTTQSTSGSSASSILNERKQEVVDRPDDESSMVEKKPLPQARETKKSRRRTKYKSRGMEEIADPDAINERATVKVDDNDDFFLMTADDMQEITKLAREFVNENSSDDEGGFSPCYLVKDAMEWLLCTSIQGGGRHTMTKKQARTWFADEDMQDYQDYQDLTGTRKSRNTKFADEDMPSSPKQSVFKKLQSASQEYEDIDNSVVQENNDDDSSDDEDDFYFEDQQSITTAKKVVRRFRPSGLICTENMAVVYGVDSMEQLEGTIETVLVADDKKYDAENTISQRMELEQADSEYGDDMPADEAFCPAVFSAHEDPTVPTKLDASKFNYDSQNYPLGIVPRTASGPMDFDDIVCESNDSDEEQCWDTVSNITSHSAHTATSQNTALHRRLQQLETELTRLQVEYQENLESPEDEEEGVMEEFRNEPTDDDSSIDGPLQMVTDAFPKSDGDSKSVRSDALQAKLAAMKMLQAEKVILEKRVQELVANLEASELYHSKQMIATKKLSEAKLQDLQYQHKGALDEATLKIQELESSLLFSQTKMADIRAKYSRDLEAAKRSQSTRLNEIQSHQKTALDEATCKIVELESSLEASQSKLEELKEKYGRDLEAASKEQLFKARARDLRENDLRSSLEEVEYKAEKGREESERMVREIRAEHTKQIEEMIQQLDVVVAQHEKEHAKEFEKLIAQLDLVVAEHEEKTKAMDNLVQEKDALIANLGSQLAEAQRCLIQSNGSA